MSWCPEILSDLPLTSGALDRAAVERRDPGTLTRALADPATRVLELRSGRAYVEVAEEGAVTLALRAPTPADAGPAQAPAQLVFLGRDEDDTAYLLRVEHPHDPHGTQDPSGLSGQESNPTPPQTPLPPEPRFPSGTPPTHAAWLGLRGAGQWLPPRQAALFAQSLALDTWHRTHRYCPACGALTRVEQCGWVRACPVDHSEHYPPSYPSIIVAVVDDRDRLLLGRNPAWDEGRFSVLAGFVEPGESFEQAVAREVAEETGIEVGERVYVGSQPWPFPASLMVGYLARARTTDIVCDPVEMAEAIWVTRQDYLDRIADGRLRTPTGFSIALRLIEHWLGRRVAGVARPARPATR